jgi:hypothetical protein
MADESSSGSTVHPSSSHSSVNVSLPSLDEWSVASVNPSPIVSSFSSANLDDGYHSPLLSQSGIRTSTPGTPSVALEFQTPTQVQESQTSTTVTPPVAAQSSCGSSEDQSIPLPSHNVVQNPLVRAGLVLSNLADIFNFHHRPY